MPGYWWVYVLVLMAAFTAVCGVRPRATVCLCGDDRDMHEHYRAGSDCGRCGKVNCPRFRGAR